MILRQARAGDAPDIARIANHVIAETLVTFTTILRRPGDIATDIATRAPAYLVLEAEGRAEGFATYGPFRGGPGYVATVEHSIQLSPAIQGRGGGRLLLSALIDIARERGVHVMIGGVSSANPGGIAFHRAMGFDETGRLREVGRKQGQWLDLVLMQKLL